MPLLTQTPAQFISALVGGVAAATNRVTNFTSGSVVGAILNSVAAQLLFNQQQAQFAVAVSRAATSSGSDLTSFVADWGLSPARSPAVAAQSAGTQVTFGRFAVSSSTISLPVGTVIQNQSLTSPIQYRVIADASQPTFNSGQNAYVLAPGASTLTATVQALVAGSAGNLLVASGGLKVIVSTGSGVDYVAQSTDIANGSDQESDPALRVRFRNYILGLSNATAGSIGAAIASVQAGLTYVINDQKYIDGSPLPSYFTVVADDGSGAIIAGTLTAITTAIANVRAAGISYSVIAPANIAVTIAVTGTAIQPGFTPSAVRSALQSALVAGTNSNGVGGYSSATGLVSGKLSYVTLANLTASFVGSSAAQGLSSYASLTVNGGTADVPLSGYQLARTSAGSVTIS